MGGVGDVERGRVGRVGREGEGEKVTWRRRDGGMGRLGDG